MPRLPRLNLQNVLYHVACRGQAAEPLFRDAEDYQTYLALLAEYKGKHGIKLFAYCLLPREVQICLELTEQSSLSNFMHDVTSRYTKHFNRRYQRAGHLFQQRFRAVMVEKGPYLLALTAYVHSLPARAGVAAEFTSYPHTSFSLYDAARDSQNVGGTSSEIREEIREVLEELAQANGVSSYLHYLQQLEAKDLEALDSGLRGRILGSEQFVGAVRTLIDGKKQPATPAALQSIAAPRAADTRRPRGWKLRPVRLAAASGTAAMLVLAIAFIQQRMMTQEQMLALLQHENETIFSVRASTSRYEPAAAELARLAGTDWDIRLMPTSAASGASAAKDQLSFSKSDQITSYALGLRGFNSTPVRFGPRRLDGTVTWEAMQTSANGEVVSWRGEWRGGTMRGVMTRQLAGKGIENFSFVGMARGASNSSNQET